MRENLVSRKDAGGTVVNGSGETLGLGTARPFSSACRRSEPAAAQEALGFWFGGSVTSAGGSRA